MPIAIIAATAGFVALCIVGDVRTRRIPNLLCGCAILLGVLLNTVHSGTNGLFASAAGLFAAVGLLLFPFAMGGLGGGDVKMMGAIGALLGLHAGLAALLVGLGIGGVIMAIHLARLGRLWQTLATIHAMLVASFFGSSLDPLRVSAVQPGAVALPYSVPLGLGTLLVLAAPGSFGL
jgi:prepilin peptidase CpaA